MSGRRRTWHCSYTSFKTIAGTHNDQIFMKMLENSMTAELWCRYGLLHRNLISANRPRNPSSLQKTYRPNTDGNLLRKKEGEDIGRYMVTAPCHRSHATT